MMIGRPIGQPSPEQFEALERRNVAVTQRQQARSKISPAKLLQNALKALGTAQGDPKLSKLKVDGVIGPGTTKAANYAFATYLDAPNVMSTAYVRQHAEYLQGQVTAYVEAHGGVVLPPVTPVRRTTISPALPPIPTSATAASDGGLPFDTKYIWYGVAGFSVLLLLATVMRATRQPPRRKRDVEAEA
jgi:hypothetical protein